MSKIVQLFAHFCAVFARFYTTFVALKHPKSCRFLMLSCSFRLVFSTGTQKMELKSVPR